MKIQPILQHRAAHRMPHRAQLALLAAPVLLLVACAQMPTGPSVAVMPPPNKPLDVFNADRSSSCITT